MPITDIRDRWFAIYDVATRNLFSQGSFHGKVGGKAALNERGLWWVYAKNDKGEFINPQERPSPISVWQWVPEELCYVEEEG